MLSISRWQAIGGALWTVSLAFGVLALFFIGPIFTEIPGLCRNGLGWLFKDPNVLMRACSICKNWVITLFSSLLTFGLLRYPSKNSTERRWQVKGILSLILVVFIFHVYLSLGAQSLWAYLDINPMPTVWLLLSVVSLYFVGSLALGGWVWRGYNWIAQKRNSERIERHGSSAHVGLIRYLIEFFGACFWVLYLFTMPAGMTSADWNQWNGLPPVMYSLILLGSILLVFGFGEILGLSHAGKPITLKRFHSWWTLSPSMIVAFALALQVRLGTFDQQVLFWASIFSYSLSLGFALAMLAVREPFLDATKRKQWYALIDVENDS